MEEALERLAARLQMGDVVRFNRGEYSHVAIYIGRSKVIHLWSPSESDFQVRIDTLRRVQLAAQYSRAEHYHEYAALTAHPECYTTELDERMRLDHDLVPFAGQEVVNRAMEKLGEEEYDYLGYNCEHFVTWARYGFGASPQVRSHTNHVLAGALLGGVVGGIAGLVAGGIFSLFLKSDALSASAGMAAGASAGSLATDNDATTSASREERIQEVDASDSEHATSGPSSEDEDDNSMEARREQRARLWGDLDNLRTTHSSQSEELSQLDEWVESRRCRSAAASWRQYSNARHNALATRLADDELQCGICFTDLLRVRTVAFSCDHFTCGVCFNALRENTEGLKCCPYCRLEIGTVDEIHKSTKMRAKHVLQWS